MKKAPAKPKPAQKPRKAPAPKMPLPRRVEVNKRPQAPRNATPISAAGRELDARRKGRPVGMLEALGKLAEFVGGAILLAVHTPESAVRAAGGNFIEAMGGHKCGPECWHAPHGTPEERKAWWDKTLADFDARRHTSRCSATHGIAGERCTLVAGHTGAHRDAAWRDGKPGGVSWWS